MFSVDIVHGVLPLLLLTVNHLLGFIVAEHEDSETLWRRVLNARILTGSFVIKQADDLEHLKVWVLDLINLVTETLFHELHLFSLKNGGDVQLVELFVDKIDTELLEIILCVEVLKTKDVEQSNRLGGVEKAGVFHHFWLNCGVHFLDEPVEQVVEQLFGQGISIIHALLVSRGLPEDFLTCLLHRLEQDLFEVLKIHTEKLGDDLCSFWVLDEAWFGWHTHVVKRGSNKFNFSQVENRSDTPPDAHLLVFGELKVIESFFDFFKTFFVVLLGEITTCLDV